MGEVLDESAVPSEGDLLVGVAHVFGDPLNVLTRPDSEGGKGVTELLGRSELQTGKLEQEPKFLSKFGIREMQVGIPAHILHLTKTRYPLKMPEKFTIDLIRISTLWREREPARAKGGP